MAEPSLRAVINATGVIIHTNLGRAPLDEALLRGAAGCCNLELLLPTGARGGRRDHVQRVLCLLSGAEAALVVNNNAAAVVLMLAALAAGREVVISRGELVEIGGSFRIPDIMQASGARLREVGTTNRTYVRDYAAAIGADTAAILRAHPSNFRLTGFVHSATSAELAELAHERGVPFLHDLGSGTFGPVPPELPADTDPVAELAAGADLVTFSGDKLLGGPQAGIILGRRDAVEELARHPLARAFRADKLTLGALEQTLMCYVRGEPDRVAVSRMLNAPASALAARAERLRPLIEHPALAVETVPTRDPIGGGSHPEQTLPGLGLALSPSSMSADELARRLRLGEPAVMGVVREDRLLLHMRTLAPGSELAVAEAVRAATAAP